MKAARVIADRVVQRVDKLLAFFRADVTGRKVRHRAVNDSDKVTAKDQFSRSGAEVLRGGFERRATLVVRPYVIAEQGKGGHIASGKIAVRYGPHTALAAVHRDPIHVRGACGVERRLFVEPLDGLVGRTIRQYDRVFHSLSARSRRVVGYPIFAPSRAPRHIVRGFGIFVAWVIILETAFLARYGFIFSLTWSWRRVRLLG